MMTTVKTAISISESLFDQANAIAAEMNLSRSRFFALATEAYIQQYQNKKLLEAINNAYTEPTEEEALLQQGMRQKHRLLVEGEW